VGSSRPPSYGADPPELAGSGPYAARVLRVTLRSLWEHKRRLVSTVVAIVLGVAFMTGTFVFADTIDRVIEDLFADVNEQIDVRVQGIEVFDGGLAGPPVRELLDESVVDAIRGTEGVAEAEPFIQTAGFGSQNRVLGPDGDPLGASAGPPTLVERALRGFAWARCTNWCSLVLG